MSDQPFTLYGVKRDAYDPIYDPIGPTNKERRMRRGPRQGLSKYSAYQGHLMQRNNNGPLPESRRLDLFRPLCAIADKVVALAGDRPSVCRPLVKSDWRELAVRPSAGRRKSNPSSTRSGHRVSDDIGRQCNPARRADKQGPDLMHLIRT
jgi:hypothetical protein